MKKTFNYIINYFRYSFTQFLDFETKAILIVVWFLLIIVLTYKGVEQGLNYVHNDLLITLASILGTILAIFFTLVILPVQQISNRYSYKFLTYVLSDRKFKTSFLLFAVILFYYLVFIYYGSSKLIVLLSFLFFVLSLVNLWDLIQHIIKISNPMFSILLPAHDKINKETSNALTRFYDDCVKNYDQFTKGQTEITGSQLCKTKVDDKIINYIKRHLIPIREIAAKSIRDIDLETAENSLRVMTSVIIHYFKERIEYQDDQDPLMMFIYEEFKILSGMGSKETNLRFHPTIIECWVQIGVQVSKTKLNRGIIPQHLNSLVMWSIKSLKDLCINNFSDDDSYAPSKACNAMGDIGVQLMLEGYDQQASLIIDELATLSIKAIRANLSHIVNSANYAIMRIYLVGVMNRNKGNYDKYNHPYKEINEKIENVILAGLTKEKLSVLDNQIFAPFFGYWIDIFNGANFARISESALFTEGLNEYSLEMNIESIKENINTLDMILNKLKKHEDSYFSGQALDILEMIIFRLLAFINRPMAKDHILYYRKQKPKILTNQKIQDEALKVTIQGIDNLIGYARKRFDKHIYENYHLDVLFSVFFIVLYENKISKRTVLDSLFNDFRDKLMKLLEDYKKIEGTTSNDNLYKYYRLLKKVLLENNFKDISNKIVIPKYQHRDILYAPPDNEFPVSVLLGKRWILKRPIFQVNTFYFTKVEKRLKIEG